jgi:hypothetical protein
MNFHQLGLLTPIYLQKNMIKILIISRQTQANLFQSGIERDGYIQMILGVGFNGIVDIIMDEDMKMT